MSIVHAPRRRIAYFMLLLIAGLVVIGARVAYIQFVQGPQLAAQARLQLKDTQALQSPRGTIYDRAGRELAISSTAPSLYVNPRQFNKNPGEAAVWLAPMLRMNVQDVAERLGSSGSFMWLKRTLDHEQAEAVTKLIKEQHIRGLAFIEEGKRHYPNEELAAHVLGFVGVDDVGLEGIESHLDKIIKGGSQSQTVETDGKGRPIFSSTLSYEPRRHGKSVYLTIDSHIQFIVEQSLDKVMAKTQAQGVTAIVMNPRTGEILAMSSRPGFNPNRFGRYSAGAFKNRAVSIIYEPGSTFKAITAAAALNEGKMLPQERFYDQGYVEVSGRRIKNWSGENYGNISFSDVIKMSLNTGFVEIGLRLGGATLTEYTRNFGFGRPTGIELPGEEEGLLFKPGDMRQVDVATMSIGQSIAVTPLQLLTAVSAIANEGVLLKPYLIKEIHNPDGSVFSITPSSPIRQVVSPETARQLTGLLERVVSEGGGSKAAVKGYRFAGKTGTAEKLKDTGGYEENHYIASFVGYGPVEDVRLAALIVIDDPVGPYYGGEIAAPVFAEIMTQVTRYLNLKPYAPPDLHLQPGGGKALQGDASFSRQAKLPAPFAYAIIMTG